MVGISVGNRGSTYSYGHCQTEAIPVWPHLAVSKGPCAVPATCRADSSPLLGLSGLWDLPKPEFLAWERKRSGDVVSVQPVSPLLSPCPCLGPHCAPELQVRGD